MHRNRNGVACFAWVFFIVMTFVFLYPMYMAVILSISSEESIALNGFRFWPSQFSMEAYRILFERNSATLLNSLALTVGTGLVQPALSLLLTMSMAYPLSQPDFRGRDFWRVYVLITMLFSGGMVADYVLKAKYLGLRNNVMIYLLPGLSAWNVFLFRTFFISLDKAMIESAKIDGAGNFQILFLIILPLTLPLVVMNYFSGFIGRWNDITTSMYFISDKKLYTIQYLLQQMLASSEKARELMKLGLGMELETEHIPIESTRYALAVIGALPVFVLFPFIQKYYAKGITVGSTKG